MLLILFMMKYVYKWIPHGVGTTNKLFPEKEIGDFFHH